MMNPAKLLKLREGFTGFEARHPRFVKFIMSLSKSGVPVDSIIDIKVTLPDGREIETNMRVTPEDVEFIKSIGDN